ncbi:MAG: CBS domain-containing protein [Nanoarchaeota archaeon]|nr:CBS domain-containing protein [Nanoarchaeota archaeon]
MSKDVFVIDSDATIFDAAKLMVKYNTGLLIVMEKRKPAGIIAEHDLVIIMTKSKDTKEIKVKECMSKPIITVDYDDSFFKVLKLANKKKLKNLPVLKNNTIVGKITQQEISLGTVRVIKFLNGTLRKGFISSDEHRMVETEVLKNVLSDSLQKEPPWVKRELELLEQIYNEQQKVMTKIADKATKKYSLTEWKMNIWNGCQYKMQKTENNEIVNICRKLNKYCSYAPCPLNKG